MQSNENSSTLYIGNLTSQILKKDIVNLFKPFGRVISCEHEGNYAYLKYENTKNAQNASKMLNKTPQFGRDAIYVRLANTNVISNKEKDTKNDKYVKIIAKEDLFVGNLDENPSEKAIIQVFSRFGTVKNVICKTNYAFVKMKSFEEAKKAIRELNTTSQFGRNQIIVEFVKGNGISNYSIICFRCKKPGHFARDCRVELCYNCESSNHKARDCPNSGPIDRVKRSNSRFQYREYPVDRSQPRHDTFARNKRSFSPRLSSRSRRSVSRRRRDHLPSRRRERSRSYRDLKRERSLRDTRRKRIHSRLSRDRRDDSSSRCDSNRRYKSDREIEREIESRVAERVARVLKRAEKRQDYMDINSHRGTYDSYDRNPASNRHEIYSNRHDFESISRPHHHKNYDDYHQHKNRENYESRDYRHDNRHDYRHDYHQNKKSVGTFGYRPATSPHFVSDHDESQYYSLPVNSNLDDYPLNDTSTMLRQDFGPVPVSSMSQQKQENLNLNYLSPNGSEF